jgi:Flp pilus assembly protein TadG
MNRFRRFVLQRFDWRGAGHRVGSPALRDESGSALVELALMLSLLGVPLLLGTVYWASLLSDSIALANAAHAGALYGMRSSTFAEENPQITTAVTTEAVGIGSNITVTPTIFYACSTAIDGTQYATQAAANSACTGGTNHSLEFIQVFVTANVRPFTSFPGLPSPATLTSTSVMEVEE